MVKTSGDKIRINLKLQPEYPANPKELLLRFYCIFRKKKMLLTEFLWSFQVQPVPKQGYESVSQQIKRKILKANARTLQV